MKQCRLCYPRTFLTLVLLDALNVLPSHGRFVDPILLDAVFATEAGLVIYYGTCETLTPKPPAGEKAQAPSVQYCVKWGDDDGTSTKNPYSIEFYLSGSRASRPSLHAPSRRPTCPPGRPGPRTRRRTRSCNLKGAKVVRTGIRKQAL